MDGQKWTTKERFTIRSHRTGKISKCCSVTSRVLCVINISHRRSNNACFLRRNSPVAPEDKKYTPLTMEGTSYREKECPDDWCLTQNTIKWSGPGEEGVWIDPKFQKHPLDFKTRFVSVE